MQIGASQYNSSCLSLFGLKPVLRAMTLDMLFDYFAVRVNREKAEGKQEQDANASLTLMCDMLNQIMLKKATLKDAVSKGDIKIQGDQA